MEVEDATISLGVQIGITAGFVLLMTVIHAVGLVGISRLLRLDADRLRDHAFDVRAVLLLAVLGVSLFALHIFEIVIFALFYFQIGAVATFEESLHYSASAYATLGSTAEYFPAEWRLIGALEALVGFILIGWSTAFMVNTMRKLTR